jgi:S1-C subfamily serine protease
VVADPQAQYVIITSSGKQYSARVLSLDPTTDLAILRAYTPDGKPFQPKQFLSFMDSSKKTQIGTFVLAIGNALAEFQNSVTL